VDVETLRAAAAAGCDEVLTRGQFQQCYAALLESKCRSAKTFIATSFTAEP
jgi:hypothetical protein